MSLASLVNGVLLGLVYTMMAVGLSITLGVMRIINVAHSAFIILGTYAGYQIWRVWDVNPMISLIVLAPVFFVLGALAVRYLVEPLARADETMVLVSLFGLLIVIETIITLIWGADSRSVSLPYSGTVIDLGFLAISVTRLVAGLACLALVGGTHLFMRKTFTGKAIRAMSENRDAATILGVNVKRLNMIVFGMATAAAAFSGAALSTIFAFTPQIHFVWLAWAFLVVVLGGLGSIGATLVAGLLVGVAESALGQVLPFQYVYLSMFVLLGLILLLQSEGLLIRRTRRI